MRLTFSPGPVTTKPIPVTDIEAKVPTLPRTRDCSPLDRLIDILCAKGVIPPEICKLKGHGGGAEFDEDDDHANDDSTNGGDVGTTADTPKGSFVVNRPGHDLHGQTVTFGDGRNKHTKNAYGYHRRPQAGCRSEPPDSERRPQSVGNCHDQRRQGEPEAR